MKADHHHVAVIGGGVAGLTAVDALAGWGVQVSLFEKTSILGGHAVQLNCKATDACVKCGACVAADKLWRATRHANVDFHTDTEIEEIAGQLPYRIRYRSHRSGQSRSAAIQADAILVTTGFSPYDPSEKPYGYGQFENVITSLDAERLLRENTLIRRPSDGQPARRMAFIQCVGSRDARLGHDWCSKICCASSMRMARLIQSRQPDTQITFFYIDVQTFGKDFQCFYQIARENFSMIRAIPCDIFRTAADDLEVIYFDPHDKASKEAFFDVVVLSIGLVPGRDNADMARMLGLPLDASGFMHPGGDDRRAWPAGVYTAGAATGPMTIAESVSSAEKSVFDIVRYLGVG